MAELWFPPTWRVVRLPVGLLSPHGIRKTVPMILDPGTASVILARQTALDLGYDLVGTPARSMTSAHSTRPAEVIQLAEVTAVGERVPGVEALCTELDPKLRVSGLLGNTFLRHFRLTLELANGWLRLDPIEPTPTEG